MLQLADNDVDGDQIKTPFGNDEVRVSLGGFHKLEMHRPDDVHVLRHHGLDRAAPLARVPQEAADEPDVGIRVDVELDVQQVAQRRVLQHQDTLEDDDGLRFDVVGPELAFIASVTIHGHINRLATGQTLEMFDQQIIVIGTGMVVIDAALFLDGHTVEVPVVRILLVEDDWLCGLMHDLLSHGGLARAGTAGDADKDGTCHLNCLQQDTIVYCGYVRRRSARRHSDRRAWPGSSSTCLRGHAPQHSSTPGPDCRWKSVANRDASRCCTGTCTSARRMCRSHPGWEGHIRAWCPAGATSSSPDG